MIRAMKEITRDNPINLNKKTKSYIIKPHKQNQRLTDK